MESLFKQLSISTQDQTTNLYFQNSGMTNKYKKLKQGFFPLGKGILSEDKTSDRNFKTMVLGNDFGTETYLTECIKMKKCESYKKSPTIRNLKKLWELDFHETFFTNFHLGVRTDGTNTQRAIPLTKEFQNFCYEFFLKQLMTINPKLVICLGQEVRLALINKSDAFSLWKPKSISIKKLYEREHFKINIADKELGNRTFILIPHPCDSRNFKAEYVDKVRPFLS